MGVPVIGCNRRGVRELILHEVTGLNAARSKEGIFQAMELILTEPELLPKLSTGAIQVRDRLSRNKFYREIESDLYIE